MGRNKEMIGSSYSVVSQDENIAIVNGSYLCPYCEMNTSAQFTVNSGDFNLLDSGGFYDNLTCGFCGKNSSVRFWSSQRV